MSKFLLLLAVSLALGLAATGCGGDDDEEEAAPPATTEQPAETEPATGDGTELTIAADAGNELAFDEESLTAQAGTVTITMENPADLTHNVSIEGGGVDEEGEIVGKGEESTVTADLEAGEYTFYCSVPGHREGGMEGTLTVE